MQLVTKRNVSAVLDLPIKWIYTTKIIIFNWRTNDPHLRKHNRYILNVILIDFSVNQTWSNARFDFLLSQFFLLFDQFNIELLNIAEWNSMNYLIDSNSCPWSFSTTSNQKFFTLIFNSNPMKRWFKSNLENF